MSFMGYTRDLGRKRVSISTNDEASSMDLSKKQRFEEIVMGLEPENCRLQSLPPDILVKIVCGVSHGDLKALFHVCKATRQATLIAKDTHFANCTPSQFPVSRTWIGSEDLSEFEEIAVPKVPEKKPNRRRLNDKELASISVALFASPGGDNWPVANENLNVNM